MLRKKAIAVATSTEPESNFVAGMPATPQGSGPAREVLAIKKVQAFPRTTASKGEAGMSDVIAEGASQMVSDLERKFGSDRPFVLGFNYELDKQAAPEWLKRLVGSQTQKAIPKTQLQQGVINLKARLSAAKPQLTPKAPMPHEAAKATGDFPVMDREARTLAKLDARASRGRSALPALQV